jgi:hypothetical protein
MCVCVCVCVLTKVYVMIRKINTSKKVNPSLKNTESKYVTPTAKDDPVLPGLFVFQGMRGSGKTYAAVMMCRHFETKGYINRTFLLCPTAGDKDQKDTIYANLRTLKQNDVCTNITNFELALQQVEQRIKEDWAKYEEYQKHKKAWDKHVEKKPLSVEEVSILEQYHYFEPSHEVKPKRHMLILDDCQGSNVYTTARHGMLNHLAIKHRHIPVTICFLVQSWVGCPRTIRLNATQYCIFRTSDKTQLDQIYSAFANNVPREVFDEVYEEATTTTKHGFLYIDVVPKEPYMRFRLGFDTYLVPESNGDVKMLNADGDDKNPSTKRKRKDEEALSDDEKEEKKGL